LEYSSLEGGISMESQPTCGQGLAENAVLPAKLGELTASLAENLEAHMKALDPKDKNAKKELDAYRKLATELRRIGDELEAIATAMAGYRDLPVGRHDAKAMSGPKVRPAFEKFVTLEQELLALLQKRVEQERTMLVQMRGPGAVG
jgi:hypothetical protein